MRQENHPQTDKAELIQGGPQTSSNSLPQKPARNAVSHRLQPRLAHSGQRPCGGSRLLRWSAGPERGRRGTQSETNTKKAESRYLIEIICIHKMPQISEVYQFGDLDRM